MKLLEEKIVLDGKVLNGSVLKVGSFLNHQMDVAFLNKLAEEFYKTFRDCGVTKVLTIEASGIGIACLTAQFFNCPMVFAKKGKTSNINNDVYCCPVESFTHNTTYNVMVEKEFLKKDDCVLIIDDFLAKGQAVLGLLKIAEDAGAKVAGVGIVIEKAFQDGGQIIRNKGIKVKSLARISAMSENGLEFID